MSRPQQPVGRLSRKLGIGITEKGQKILNRRPNKPGQHGPTAKKAKQSEYGKRLLEKQRARFLYGLLEGQFLKTFERAAKMPGATGENLLILLERRLDNTVYRMGLAKTRAQARQLVGHGHIYINGRKVDRPSYVIRKGEVLSVHPVKIETAYYTLLRESGRLDMYTPPAWLSLDKTTLTATVVDLPTRADAEQAVEEQLVVEFYAGR